MPTMPPVQTAGMTAAAGTHPRSVEHGGRSLRTAEVDARGILHTSGYESGRQGGRQCGSSNGRWTCRAALHAYLQIEIFSSSARGAPACGTNRRYARKK